MTVVSELARGKRTVGGQDCKVDLSSWEYSAQNRDARRSTATKGITCFDRESHLEMTRQASKALGTTFGRMHRVL